MWGQWISHKTNIRHPVQLKKWKSWGTFWSYQLNSTAHPVYLTQNWACLAGTSKTTPRILIFSIAMGVDYSFWVKYIAINAPTFLWYKNSVLAIVTSPNFWFYSLIKSLSQDFIKITLYLILINSCTFFKCHRLRHLNNMTLGWPFYLQFR